MYLFIYLFIVYMYINKHTHNLSNLKLDFISCLSFRISVIYY